MLFWCIKNENTGLVAQELDHTGKGSVVYPINSRMYEKKKGGIEARCGERLF